MRKYARDYVSGERNQNIIHSSKQSGELTYKPVALWKTAPVITFASQTADGEITLQWDHDDNGIGCEYLVMKINKVFGVMTGEEQLAKTNEHEYVIQDLTNGSYCINIVPVLGNEKGSYSGDANVEVKNDWVVAPELTCEQLEGNQIKLTWTAAENIEQYHITVFAGDSDSLLRFVDMDYKKIHEDNINAEAGTMEYLYTYDSDSVRLKFEVYGIHHTKLI